MDAEGSVSPAASVSPAPPSPSPAPTIEELKMQMKPCKVVLEDCFNGKSNDDDDDDDDSHDGGDQLNGAVDDGYEDSSEIPLLPNRGTGLRPTLSTPNSETSNMLKPPSAGLPHMPQKHKDSHTSIYSTSFKHFTLKCCFPPCNATADSIRDITDHFKLAHNLSAAAMVWDKPMEPGQKEPEWQKRFEVIITHGEKESIELAQGGFKRTLGVPNVYAEKTKKGKTQFQCSRCDAQQQQVKSMIRHIEEQHCGFRRYTCGLCGKQTHAVHMQLEHWNAAHSHQIGSKESLVIYSRHLTLSEMTPEEFEEMRRKRPPLVTATNEVAIPQNGLDVDVKPALNLLSASSSSSVSADSGVRSDVGAEPEAQPPNKRARTNSQKQSTPIPVVASAALMPQTSAAVATATMLLTPPPPKAEMATEPGEYEFLMPVKVRVSDDKIRYITFGVPRSGDKVKDQIIQLRQLDTPMLIHQNCFPMPTALAAAAAVPTTPSILPKPRFSTNAGVMPVPSYIAAAAGSHVIVQTSTIENGRQGSPLVAPAAAASNIHLQARHAAPKILTIPQAPSFPINAAPAHILPLTSVAASTNGVPAGATLIPNPIAIPGLVNGVAMISPQVAQQPPIRPPVVSQQTVSVPSKPQQHQLPTPQQQQQQTLKPQHPPAAQRVEVGDAAGTSMAAVATVLTRYKCNQCEAVYNNRDSIVAHIYTHMKVRPFKCALCNSIAAMSKTILKHLTKEHGTNDPSLILEQRIPNESSYYSAIQ